MRIASSEYTQRQPTTSSTVINVLPIINIVYRLETISAQKRHCFRCVRFANVYVQMDRKERGGIQQRKAKRQKRELEENEVTKSILAYHLVNLVMWGLLSGVRCQQIAQWAVQDGLGHPEIMILASWVHQAGTSRTCTANYYGGFHCHASQMHLSGSQSP